MRANALLVGAALLGAALMLVVALSAGCAPTASATVDDGVAADRADTAAPPLPADALPVPLVRQATSYSCGAASLLAVLYYWQAFDGQESELYGPLHTTEADGTEPYNIEKVARDKYALDARYRTDVTVDDLHAALAAGQTVILDLQAWQDRRKPWATDWDDGHYVVLVGFDDTNLFAMDPSAGAAYAYLPVDEFVTRWHDVETKNNTDRKLQHMAIFIGGTNHLPSYPAPLAEMR